MVCTVPSAQVRAGRPGRCRSRSHGAPVGVDDGDGVDTPGRIGAAAARRWPRPPAPGRGPGRMRRGWRRSCPVVRPRGRDHAVGETPTQCRRRRPRPGGGDPCSPSCGARRQGASAADADDRAGHRVFGPAAPHGAGPVAGHVLTRDRLHHGLLDRRSRARPSTVHGPWPGGAAGRARRPRVGPLCPFSRAAGRSSAAGAVRLDRPT